MSRGVAVATNRRLLFVNKRLFGSADMAEIGYDRIEGITYSKGVMFGGVKVIGMGGSGWSIDAVKPKESAQPFADRVRILVDKAKPPAPTTPASDADELVKWAGLLDGGLITQEQFDQKRAEILGV